MPPVTMGGRVRVEYEYEDEEENDVNLLGKESRGHEDARDNTLPGDCSGAFLFYCKLGYGAVTETWLEAGLSVPALL